MAVDDLVEVSKRKQLRFINYIMKKMINVVRCHTLEHSVHDIKGKTLCDIKTSQVFQWAGTIDTVSCRVMAHSFGYQFEMVTIAFQVSFNKP